MDHHEALDLVEQLIQENLSQLTPDPRPEPQPVPLLAPCSGPNDDLDTGEVMVEHGYRLRGIDPVGNDAIFGQLRRYWTDRGYRMMLDIGTPGWRRIVAAHPDNGFRVFLIDGQQALTLGAQSTCVPQPSSEDDVW